MDSLSPVSVGGLVVLATTTVSVAVASILFCRKKLELPEDKPAETAIIPAAAKKQPAKKAAHSVADKAHAHHHLCVNTVKGHQDGVTGIAFSFDGKALATACGDRVVRVFKLEDCASKSFKFLRINLPLGSCPTAVAFGEGSSQLVIAAEDPSGAYVCMYGSGRGAGTAGAEGDGGKLPPPEMKWEKKLAHNGKSIITLVSARSHHGGGDGGVLAASSSEGTDIKVWLANDGKCVGHVDTNQLQNHMAALSPDGRFLAAAAFTADVKIWEVQYEKNGAVKEVVKCMQLKGHKSAVTWLSFSADSQRVVTVSKDGTIKIWNINVRYHLQEDPKCLLTFDIPLPKEGKHPPHYDRVAISPDNRILAASVGPHVHWLSAETGEVLDEAKNAHDGFITCLVWAPAALPTGEKEAAILATASVDKKLKLWTAPPTQS